MNMDKYKYCGNRKPFAVVLCSSSNISAVEPVLDIIDSRALSLCMIDENTPVKSKLKKACGVICVLSENFAECEVLHNLLLQASSLDKSIVPVRTDESTQPEFINRILYSTNSINLLKYTPEKAADRILTADVLAHPKTTKAQNSAYKRTAAVIAAAALAVVFAVAVPLVINRNTENTDAVIDPYSQIPSDWSITEEEILNTTAIILAGDIREEDATASDDIWSFYTQTWDEDKECNAYYRISDGTRSEPGGFENLSFLARFTNLQTLVLINQTAEEFPDLSSLKHLQNVQLWDCEFKSIDGLAGCPALNFVHITLPNITDISPLNNCPYLRTLHITSCAALTDLGGLNLPKLTELQFHTSTAENLSGLSTCTALTNLEINWNSDSTLNLQYLTTCTKLQYLNIQAYNSNVDLSPLSGITGLTHFECECSRFSNAEALSGNSGIIIFTLASNGGQRTELDFLKNFTKLSSLNLGGIQSGFDVLSEGFSGKSFSNISVWTHGNQNFDWTGLGSLKAVSSLSADFNFGGNASNLLGEIQNVNVRDLRLAKFLNADLTLIPNSVKELTLDECRLSNLSDLQGDFYLLELQNMDRLTSLDGLEKLENLDEISIECCLHITDWDALYEPELISIKLENQYSLPDFGKIRFKEDHSAKIDLRNIIGMTDLSCLDALSSNSTSIFYITAIGESLTDLSALYNINLDNMFKASLTVWPTVVEQAQALVDNGNFRFLSIEYPDSGWSEADIEFTLTSLDELESVPALLLSKVRKLSVIGEYVFENGETKYEYERDENVFYAENLESEEWLEITEGGAITDISALSGLTGLECLSLGCQPLESLNGIQSFENLSTLRIEFCNLSDKELLPIFAVSSLEELILRELDNIDEQETLITSINGIQNLYNLSSLDVSETHIADYSPLKQLNFNSNVKNNGFSLKVSCMVDIEDWSFLAAIPKYSQLILHDSSTPDFLDYLEGKEIECMHFCNTLKRNDELERFVAGVSGLKEIKISCDYVTDITCLLEVEGLETVIICENMTEAFRSLEGKNYSFELLFED